MGDLLTPIVLAYWFMDDGYRVDNGFYVCTESFTMDDQLLLVKALIDKFGLSASLHKYGNSYR